MRTIEVLQVLAALLGAFFSVVMAMEQRLVKRLRQTDATSAERAIELGSIRPLTRWRLASLKKAGAVRIVDSGAVFLHEESFRALRKRRVITAVAGVTLAVALVLIVHAFLR